MDKNVNLSTHKEKELKKLQTDRFGLERLIFFSDAVFAIAITLLVLEIRLPSGMESMGEVQLLESLLGIWHKYLAYAVSFMVVGAFWISHHRKFRLIERYDGRLLILNLLFLMTIAFIPFPSSVISENGNRTGTIFYALIMIAAGLLITFLWWYSSRNNRLTASHIDRKRRRREATGPLAIAAIFILSIGIAFIDDDLAKFSWLLILPVTLLINRA